MRDVVAWMILHVRVVHIPSVIGRFAVVAFDILHDLARLKAPPRWCASIVRMKWSWWWMWRVYRATHDVQHWTEASQAYVYYASVSQLWQDCF